MAGKKSAVWDYFNFLKKGTEHKKITVCNICKTQIKYMTGSTSSMTAHILRRHGITLSKTKAAAENCQKNKPTSTGQLRLPEALGLRNKYPDSSTRHGDITRSISVCCFFCDGYEAILGVGK